APLASGLLTGGPPPAWHPVPADARRFLARATIRAEELGTSLPRLALQFGVSEPRLPVTVFSVRSRAELAQALSWVAEPFDPDVVAEVQAELEPLMNVQWAYGGTDPANAFASEGR